MSDKPTPDMELGNHPAEQLVRAVWLTAEEVDLLRDLLGGRNVLDAIATDAIDRELNRARHRPGVFKLSARGDVDR